MDVERSESGNSTPDLVQSDECHGPTHWVADVVLRDGSTVHLRPIRPSDGDALQAFHIGQSERSIYFRFFAPKPRLSDADLVRFTQVDYKDRVAFVAITADPQSDGSLGERIIGVARYDRSGERQAEVAFNISDAHHGRGLGSVLLEHLAAAAQEHGITRFQAEVLPRNHQMLSVFVEAGYDVRRHHDDGVIYVGFDIDPTARSLEVTQAREHASEARSMELLLNPARVAVIGPEHEDPRHSAIAGRILDRLAARESGVEVVATGAGLARDGVHHVESLGHVLADERNIDLVVLARPAVEVLGVVHALSGHGVRGLILASGGFAETGETGSATQVAVRTAAHRAGMRIIGPASYGVLSTVAEVTFDASQTPWATASGNVGIFCQSAQVAATIQSAVRQRDLGISEFLSAGNRADVSGNDMMQWWRTDTSTQVACLYLESIGNPRKFSQIARRLAATKPVVVATAGRSGQVAPAGHVVKTSTVPRRTLAEVLRRSGVIHAESLREMMDVAQCLSTQPRPEGNRTLVVASAPSLLSLVAESAVDANLTVSSASLVIDPQVQTEEQISDQLARTLAEDAPHALIAVDIPMVPQESSPLIRAAAAVAKTHGITAVASTTGPTHTWRGDDLAIPVYATPEDAAGVLGRVCDYVKRGSPEANDVLLPEGTDRITAQQIIDPLVADEPVTLDAESTQQLLEAYGIDVWPATIALTAQEAVRIADDFGYPVVLKSTDPALRHRADLGGVRLNIADADDMRRNFADMEKELRITRRSDYPLQVQRMAPPGVACVIRAVEDHLFGPVTSFALAGDAVELLGDVSYGIPPLTRADITDMISSVKASPKLFGYKGQPPMATGAIEDLLARVSALSFELPQLKSLDLYPIVVSEDGIAVLSATASVVRPERTRAPRRALAN